MIRAQPKPTKADRKKKPTATGKRKPAKLTAAKVQVEFNAAILRADGKSHLSGGTENLQCSHFYAVGGSGALRFYPPNAHAQTAAEHTAWHNGRAPMQYPQWMAQNVPIAEWMETARKRTVKYNRDTLGTIMALCKANEMVMLKAYIENLIDAAPIRKA